MTLSRMVRFHSYISFIVTVLNQVGVFERDLYHNKMAKYSRDFGYAFG